MDLVEETFQLFVRSAGHTRHTWHHSEHLQRVSIEGIMIEDYGKLIDRTETADFDRFAAQWNESTSLAQTILS